MNDIQNTETTLMCIGCGFKIKVGTEICAECGESLDGINSIIVEPKKEENELTEEDLENGPQRRPWVRYFARSFDFSLLGVLIAPFMPILSNQLMQDLIYYGLLAILWIPIEALFLSKCMTTPGKWLFNITVKNTSDEKLTYEQAFRRGFMVYYKGLFLGIPILNLFSAFNSYSLLLETGKTVWDLKGDIKVQHKKIGMKFILIILAFVMLRAVTFIVENGFQVL